MRRLSALLIVVVLMAGLFKTAEAQSRWVNYLDPSYVTELVYRDGSLYAATYGGLLVYDISADKFASYDNVSGLVSNQLSCLAFDADGDLYVGTADVGIQRVRVGPSGLKVVDTYSRLIDGLASNAIRTVAIWQNALLYGTDEGAGRVVGTFASQPWDTLDGLPSLVVNDVMPMGSNAWVATDGGIVVIDALDLVNPLPGAPASGNVIGSDGQFVWIGTDAGVWRYDPSVASWTDVGLDNRRVYSLTYDGQSMWAGGSGSGSPRIFEYQSGQTWTGIPLSPVTSRWELGNAFTNITGLVVVPGGDVYAGAVFTSEFRGFHLARWDGSTLENIQPSSPAANNVERISLDPNGSVWTSFRNFYVGKLTPNDEWINYNPTIPEGDSVSSRFTNLAFLADSQGRKWFGSLSEPFDQEPLDLLVDQGDDDYANDVWDHFFIGDGGGDGLGSLRFQRAFEDPAGNVWFLCDSRRGLSHNWWGIQILKADGSEWLQVNPTNSGLMSGDVTYVAFDNASTYVATRDYGVQLWTHNGFGFANLKSSINSWIDVNATLSDDLTPAAAIYAIAIGSGGKLWVGTEVGVFRRSSGGWDHFDVYRGIGDGLLSPKVNDVLLDHDENLWVATDLGLNRIMKDGFEVEAHSTEAAYQEFLAELQFSFEKVVSDLANARVRSLAIHPEKDILYVGTTGGLSIFDYTPAPPTESNLSDVYVYPNPLYGSRGQQRLMIENITGAVSVDIYNIEGQLVHSQSADTPGQTIWPLTTSGGFVAASGVYLVRISNSTSSIVKRVAVIR